MTKIKKRKVLVSLVATFALAAFVSIASLGEIEKAFAEESTSSSQSVVITPDVTADATEFYMNEGAAIRTVDDDVNGIRFTATLTEAYWEKLQNTYGTEATYTFYSVVTNGTTGIKKVFPSTTPYFTNGEEDYLTSITYNVSTWSDSKKAEAYALELEANTYIDVTVGKNTTTIAANGSTGVRSMRVVANDLYLTETIDGEPNEWYQSEALEAYLTVANRSEETWGGFDSTGVGVVKMPELPSGTTVDAVYLGTQKLAATVSDGTISFEGVDAESTGIAVGEQTHLSIFAGEKVYSCKVAYANAVLKARTFQQLSTATDGYYVLGENITIGTGEDEVDYSFASASLTFSGTFNGLDHTISNLNVTDGKGGLVGTLTGTVKNVAIVNASFASNASQAGFIASASVGGTIENVYVSGTTAGSSNNEKGPWQGGMVGKVWSGTLTVKNAIVNLADCVEGDVTSGYVAGMARQTITLEDCYFIGGNKQINGTRYGYSCSVNKTNVQDPYDDDKAYLNAIYPSGNISVLSTDLLKELSALEIESNYNLLWKEDFADLAGAIKGEYLLMENITIGTGEGEVSYPTPSTTFEGTFDGNGHTISNLSVTSSQSGGLFKSLGECTIKNLAIVNATIAEGRSQSGIIAQTTSTGTHTIENVYVSATLAGSSDASKGPWQGGIVGQGWNGTLALTNVIVNLAECADDDVTTGFVCGYARSNQPITLENCYFIGGNKQINGTRTNYSVTPTKTNVEVYANAPKYLTALNALENAITLPTDLLTEWSASEIESNYTLLWQDDFTDKFAGATEGNYLLMEDIDMSGVSFVPTTTFTGTLDGNGYTISNLSVGNAKGGLINTLSGTVKNLAIVNATIAEGYSQSGIIARQLYDSATVENVFVSGSMVGKSTADDQWNGGIVGVGHGGNLTLTNVIVKLADCADDDVTTGFVAGFARDKTHTLTNCWFIGGNGQLYGTRPNFSLTPTQTNVNIYDDVVAFNEAYSELTLTEELSAWCDEYNYIRLTKSNFADLATATDGYYLLMEDITIGTGEGEVSYPTPSATFAGVFEGNGYSISGLTVTANQSGGLFATLSGATIKNLAIVNATVSSTQSGILAYRIAGAKSTVENVYISGSLKSAEESFNGAIHGVSTNGDGLALKNVIINLTATSDVGNGFISGYTSRIYELTNCYFIGGNGQYSGTRSGYIGDFRDDNVKIYANVPKYLKALNARLNALTLPTDLLKEYSESEIESNYIILTQDNFTEKLAEATDGYYLLAEDITIGTGYTLPAASSTFAGTLDGNGYAISGLTVKGSKGGLFGILTGTVKNLAIVNANISSDAQNGVIAQDSNGGTIENVFVSATIVGGTEDLKLWNGGLIGKLWAGSLTVKNVVVNLAECADGDVTTGFVAGMARKVLKLENCWFIGGNGLIHGTRTGYSADITSSAPVNSNTYANVDAFNAVYSELTLTDELSVWCAEYLESIPYAQQYKIVIPEGETTDGVIYFAAQEFQLLFAEATGAEIEIITDAEIYSATDGRFISLGGTSIFAATGLSTANYNLGENGFWLKTVGDDLYIVADEAYGVLFGVYGYMERAFNFDCFTQDCYVIDEVTDFDLAELDTTDIPSIAIRNCGNRFILSDTQTLRRMRYTDRDSTTFIGSPSAHTTMSYYLPIATYYADHSDWYASPNANYETETTPKQICYTAHGDETEYAAMQTAVLDRMKADAMANMVGHIFVFSSEDNMSWCTCENCLTYKETYGDAENSYNGWQAGVQIMFINDLAAGMREWMASEEGAPYARDFRIMFFAYNGFMYPPQNITCHPNVMVAYTPAQMDYQQSFTGTENAAYYQYLQGWKEVCSTIGFYIYQTNFYHYLAPFNSFDNLPSLYREAAKVDGYWLFDLGQRDVNATGTGFQVFKGYLSSKLGWYAGEDLSGTEFDAYIEELTGDFFTNYFGDAATAMRSYYDSYRTAAATAADTLYNCWKHAPYGVNPTNRNPLWDDEVGSSTYGTKYYQKADIDQWLVYINNALTAISSLETTDPEQYQELYDRIRLERIAVYYMMVELYASEYTDIETIKATLKSDCADLGITISSAYKDKVADLWTTTTETESTETEG